MNCIRLYTLLLSLATLACLILTGCSDDDKPENFEPVIEMLPASGITRTEAVVSARIQKRGNSGFTHLAFRYGEKETLDFTKAVEDNGTETVTMQLTGLKPGHTYYCCLEAGTATAYMRSETISFTTQPNELPKVSQPVALSTGPTGIIIEFEITDNGGEDLLSAGCDVRNAATGDVRRVNLAPDCLTEGPHRLVIGNLTPLTRFIIIPFAANSIGESTGDAIDFTTQTSIVLLEPGILATIFEGTTRLELEQLVISGEMNGDDFRFLRALLGAPVMADNPQIESLVTSIDLTDVNIVEGGGSYDGSRFTENNNVTTDLFADCMRLRVALLPASATVLARNAVARCAALEELTIPAGIETLLPSAGCTALRDIEVSPGNSNFASVDGVLFNYECTGILWFPLGKTGTYTIPPTVTEIGENAFLGTRITGLVIPPSVTKIGRGAFAGSALTEITLPDNQTNISEGMFQNCTELTTVHLGTATNYIGNYAFDSTGLQHLFVAAKVPPFAAGEAFYNRSFSMTKTCVLHVPQGSVKIYRNHSKWGQFEQIEEF